MRKRFLAFAVVLIWGGAFSLFADALTEKEIAGLLAAGFSSEEVAAEVRAKGYGGRADVEVLKQLREAGANAALVLLLQSSGASADKTAGKAATAPMGVVPIAYGIKFDKTLCLIGSDGSILKEIGEVWEIGDYCPKADLIPVKIAGSGAKWGYLDSKGEWKIPPKWDWAYRFSDGVAVVGLGNESDGWEPTGPETYGLINAQGEEVIPPTWPRIVNFSEGLGLARRPGSRNWCYIDPAGEVVLELATGQVVLSADSASFHEGLALVCDNPPDEDFYLGSYIDRTGKVVVPALPIMAGGPFSGSRAIIQLAKKKKSTFSNIETSYAVITREGKIVANDPRWLRAEIFREGLGVVEFEAGKTAYGFTIKNYGFINSEGSLVLPAIWKGANGFAEGLCAVLVIGPDDRANWQYINASGNVTIPGPYARAGEFRGGYAVVCEVTPDTEGGWGWGGDIEHGIIDKSGNYVVPPDRRKASRDYNWKDIKLLASK